MAYRRDRADLINREPEVPVSALRIPPSVFNAIETTSEFGIFIFYAFLAEKQIYEA